MFPLQMLQCLVRMLTDNALKGVSRLECLLVVNPHAELRFPLETIFEYSFPHLKEQCVQHGATFLYILYFLSLQSQFYVETTAFIPSYT